MSLLGPLIVESIIVCCFATERTPYHYFAIGCQTQREMLSTRDLYADIILRQYDFF